VKVDLSFSTVIEWIGILLIFSVMAAIGNWVGFNYPLQDALVGMFILCIISLIGLIIEKIIPWNVPSILYISILGLLIALPWSPISEPVIYYTSKIDLISLTTILLAYAGIAMGKDLKDFKKVGVRGVIVTFFVILGTYLASALIAQGVLSFSGMI
jgi:hypothetical protein